jgi:hypothetical protein
MAKTLLEPQTLTLQGTQHTQKVSRVNLRLSHKKEKKKENGVRVDGCLDIYKQEL